MPEITRAKYPLNPTLKWTDAEGRLTAEAFRVVKAIGELIEAVTIVDGEVTADMISVANLEAISAVLGNVIIDGDLIVNGTITTGKVALNAITATDIAGFAGDVTLATDGSYTELVSGPMTIPEDSALQILVLSTGRYNGNDCAPQFNLYRDASLVSSFTGGFIFNNFGYSPKRMPTVSVVIDAPAAGTYTYSLEARADDNTFYRAADMSDNYLLFTLFKR